MVDGLSGGQFQRQMRPIQRRNLLLGAEKLPQLVVVRPDGMCDPTLRHDAIGVELQRLLEADDRLYVV